MNFKGAFECELQSVIKCESQGVIKCELQGVLKLLWAKGYIGKVRISLFRSTWLHGNDVGSSNVPRLNQGSLSEIVS